MAKELSEEGSEESSDNLSDTQSRENNINQEGQRGRWLRRGRTRCLMKRFVLHCNTNDDVESLLDATFSTDIKLNKALC